MKVKAIITATDDSGLKGSSILWRISIFLLLSGLLLYIIGLSTPHFLESDTVKKPGSDYGLTDPNSTVMVDQYYGLWRRCVEVKDADGFVISDDCKNMDNAQQWKPAAKAMSCVGLIFLLVGLFPAFLSGCWHNGKLMAIAAVLILIGAVVAAIGCAMFVGEAVDANSNVEAGYSSYLSLIGSAVMIIGAGALFLGIRSEYLSID